MFMHASLCALEHSFCKGMPGTQVGSVLIYDLTAPGTERSIDSPVEREEFRGAYTIYISLSPLPPCITLDNINLEGAGDTRYDRPCPA